VVARQCLSWGHAAVDAALGHHRIPAGRRPGIHRHVHPGQDGHRHRRGPDLGAAVVRAVSYPGLKRHRPRLHDPREQLHAVDRHVRRLRDRAAGRRPGRLHDDDRQRAAVVATGAVADRRVDHRRAAGVPDEAPLHQRGPAAVPRGSCMRRGAGFALYRWRRGRHVQGQVAGHLCRHHRALAAVGARWLGARDPVQDPAHGPLGRHEGAVDPARAPGRLLLHGAGQAGHGRAAHPGHRHPPARPALLARLLDAGRRRTDGRGGGLQRAAGRGHQPGDPRPP
jgi:hypothetical protein